MTTHTPAPGDEAASFCATLVDEWIRMGVQHAVVAPGSRSTPLALALAARGEMKVHVFHDERSASFAALGIGMSTGRPAVLLCTSGTAATHFHGAVVEAHQSDVPMLVCTADRPPELRDVSAPQTIDQTNLFGVAVRWFHDPGVAAVEAAHTWRALAARSWIAASGVRPGPVHLNLPFREPLLGTPSHVPPPRTRGWSSSSHSRDIDPAILSMTATKLSGKRGIIVAGRGSTPEVLVLAEALGWPVFADAQSGVRESHHLVVVGFDPVLRCGPFAVPRNPEVVLRVGQPPASKVLAQWLAGSGADIVHIGPTPTIVDPDHLVASALAGDVARACRTIAGMVTRADDSWSRDWTKAGAIAQAAIADWVGAHMSEPTVARTLTEHVGTGQNLVVSSSMPIRDVEWFGAATPGVSVHSNRGANGIDGVVSTAVGVALGSGATTYLLIGDVACVHDSNGLWGLVDRGVDVRIVVTNNNGGSIFSFLPQARDVGAETFELLFGTPHGVSFAHLAAAHGIRHALARDRAELVRALSTTGPILVEVPFDRASNVSDHERINAAVNEAIEEGFRA